MKVATSLCLEAIWIGVGAVIGLFVPMAGIELTCRVPGTDAMRRMEVMIIWFSTPACGIVSGVVAAACQAYFGVSSYRNRMLICGGFNAANGYRTYCLFHTRRKTTREHNF